MRIGCKCSVASILYRRPWIYELAMRAIEQQGLLGPSSSGFDLHDVFLVEKQMHLLFVDFSSKLVKQIQPA